jgi:hypothetical protein
VLFRLLAGDSPPSANATQVLCQSLTAAVLGQRAGNAGRIVLQQDRWDGLACHTNCSISEPFAQGVAAWYAILRVFAIWM